MVFFNTLFSVGKHSFREVYNNAVDSLNYEQIPRSLVEFSDGPLLGKEKYVTKSALQA